MPPLLLRNFITQFYIALVLFYFSSDELSNLLDEIFENTIFNLMSEASRGEINLTARPRLIALPPSAKGTRKK